ncbi:MULTISPECIES: TetR/AcrR family transcriptional regulator [unclassified Lysinibacillus]|uniref:TetR/AcrR family transcriptional regulator n=1 Tax=unclassified Lysinibacillus TaxID=2636778 RepID=UPI00201238FA|nr:MULTISPECIES: TetR/AcrR family transcriptional regulator [unclassified Lysinibacillus]MCL1694458.1 TetR/AcrR family transcriptional regulator [Lysinibacillus sp. BPa_S21]MCL1699290.1 TetR/AcrR family transcriptional regulator [Lysinibacillus sp. Bpr_S20]
MAKPTGIEKSDLLTAAKQSLVEKGIEKFTLKAVAEQAGVTQGTIYYHFKSKEQIILEIVQDICENSWNELLLTDQEIIQTALLSAKSRYENDAFYHKLFFTLIVFGFTNPIIRQQIGQILAAENEHLCNVLGKLWHTSPIDGVSMETWSIFFNALMDGLALQVMMRDDFDVDLFYQQLEIIIQTLHRLGKN